MKYLIQSYRPLPTKNSSGIKIKIYVGLYDVKSLVTQKIDMPFVIQQDNFYFYFSLKYLRYVICTCIFSMDTQNTENTIRNVSPF